MTVGDSYERPTINLLRLAAAWLVIYGHSWAVTGDHSTQDILVRLFQFKASGGMAVDAFFIISGFLIAASVERNSVRGYVVSRALRIVPALVVCTALCSFVLGPLVTTLDHYLTYKEVWRYFFGNVSLLTTKYFLPGVFEKLPNTAVNGPLWTLHVEARLYVLLLALHLLKLLKPERYNPLYVLALGIGFLVFSPERMSQDAINDANTTAFFGAGVFAWLNRDKISLSWPILLGVLVVAASGLRTDRFFIGYFLAMSYGVLFLALVPKLPVLHKHDLSYGLYLYGWPCQQLVQSVSPGSPLHNTALSTVFAFGAAAISWRFVEKPALRLKRRFGVRSDPHTVDVSTRTDEPSATPAAKGAPLPEAKGHTLGGSHLN